MKILKTILLGVVLALEIGGVLLCISIWINGDWIASLICATLMFGSQFAIGLLIWAMDDGPGPVNGA